MLLHFWRELAKDERQSVMSLFAEDFLDEWFAARPPEGSD